MSVHVNGSTVKQEPSRVDVMALLKARVKAASTVGGTEDAATPIADLVHERPTLHALLTCHLEPGGPEEGATITLWGSFQGVGAILNAKPVDRKAFFAASSIQELLDGMEAFLLDPDAKWHRERPEKPAYKRPKGYAGRKG